MAQRITNGGQAVKKNELTPGFPDYGPEQEMKVIGHETIAEEAKRIAFLGLGEGLEEGDAVGVIAKDVGAVVAAIEGMIDETVIDGARWASHGSEDNEWWASRQEK